MSKFGFSQDDVGFVTAFSDDHKDEGFRMITFMHQFFPNHNLTIFDLGLRNKTKKKIGKFCNVNLRPFNFDEYPKKVRKLKEYRWKPIVIARRPTPLKLQGHSLKNLKVGVFDFVCGDCEDERLGLRVSADTMQTIELGLATQLFGVERVDAIADQCVESRSHSHLKSFFSEEDVQRVCLELEEEDQEIYCVLVRDGNEGHLRPRMAVQRARDGLDGTETAGKTVRAGTEGGGVPGGSGIEEMERGEDGGEE
ncbi:hypothetical protein WR25_10436 [Diploscapter pachys]|uniref:Uncharacterized protein n=1 Tax=Diploscapter pachys TaxID=2018661 RepID=A0A2A2JLL9_9BILA|nr:hypothetical protein WR25_10436 [Diploscapter pachys]